MGHPSLEVRRFKDKRIYLLLFCSFVFRRVVFFVRGA